MKKQLPNFLVVGAAKAGTTSLYYYLREHPNIYLNENRKELRFFSQMQPCFTGPGDNEVNQSIIKNIEEYKNFFNLKNETIKGDISPDYLFYYENSVKTIKKYIENPKIIIILRNPVERAFSQWLHFLRDGRESLSFEDALSEEENRKKSNWEWAWLYKEVGLYYKQVKAYMNNFDNVKIYLYDDLKKDRLGVVQDVYRFLGVDDSFVPKSLNEKYNVGGVPKYKFISDFLQKDNVLKKAIKPFVKAVLPSKEKREKLINTILQKNLTKPQMKSETREYLKEYFREDILKLQDLINRDLSHWIKD